MVTTNELFGLRDYFAIGISEKYGKKIVEIDISKKPDDCKEMLKTTHRTLDFKNDHCRAYTSGKKFRDEWFKLSPDKRILKTYLK